jgi:hypothetical protein
VRVRDRTTSGYALVLGVILFIVGLIRAVLFLHDLPQVANVELSAPRPLPAQKPSSAERVRFERYSLGQVLTLPEETPVEVEGTVTTSVDSLRSYIQADGQQLLVRAFGLPLHVGDDVLIRGRVHHLKDEVEVASIRGGTTKLAGAVSSSP